MLKAKGEKGGKELITKIGKSGKHEKDKYYSRLPAIASRSPSAGLGVARALGGH
jgi:hypothetical protein